MTLIAAFDTSGDSATPILSVGGFVSSEKDWEAFTRLWTERLSFEGIRYFRAVEAAHFNGEFRRWKSTPANEREKWRRRLFADLMEIIQAHTYRHFGCSIVNKAFGQIDPTLRDEFYLTAFSVAGRTCEKHVRQWINTDWKNTNVGVGLIFEEGDQGKGKLQTRLSNDDCYSPTFRPKRDVLLEDGTIRPGFVPLQAADWYAYELSVATKDLTEGVRQISCVGDLRWPMQQFLRKAGVPGIFAVEEMQQFEQLLRLHKDLNAWWRVLKNVGVPRS